MIATERFVFLHLHKSAGTFVNQCLLRFLPEARELGYHLPRKLIPSQVAHLPVLGIVRNPWSYYVSWYTFQAARAVPNSLFRVLSDDGRLDFAGTVRNMLDLGTRTEHLRRLVAALPTGYGNRGLNLPGFELAPIRGSGRGFYSYLYRHIFGDHDAALHVGRMERLAEDLPAMLDQVGQSVSPAMREHLLTGEPRNVSPHGAYEDYYDDDLRDLVAERDAAVIARHGYRFGGQTAVRAT
jgi:hypothetical protein